MPQLALGLYGCVGGNSQRHSEKKCLHAVPHVADKHCLPGYRLQVCKWPCDKHILLDILLAEFLLRSYACSSQQLRCHVSREGSESWIPADGGGGCWRRLLLLQLMTGADDDDDDDDDDF